MFVIDCRVSLTLLTWFTWRYLWETMISDIVSLSAPRSGLYQHCVDGKSYLTKNDSLNNESLAKMLYDCEINNVIQCPVLAYWPNVIKPPDNGRKVLCFSSVQCYQTFALTDRSAALFQSNIYQRFGSTPNVKSQTPEILGNSESTEWPSSTFSNTWWSVGA